MSASRPVVLVAGCPPVADAWMEDATRRAASAARVPKETDEEYLARVAPYLDNEGRARAVPLGGDS